MSFHLLCLQPSPLISLRDLKLKEEDVFSVGSSVLFVAFPFDFNLNDLKLKDDEDFSVESSTFPVALSFDCKFLGMKPLIVAPLLFGDSEILVDTFGLSSEGFSLGFLTFDIKFCTLLDKDILLSLLLLPPF